MRILRYHPRAATGDGGMSNAVRRWSAALAGIGAGAAIAYDEGAPEETGEVEWIAVAHHDLGGQRIPKDFGRVLRGIDVLVLHGGWSAHNVVAGRAARKARVPYILEPRGAYDPHLVARRRWVKRAWWLGFERGVVNGARGLHAFFDTEREHFAMLGYRGPTVIVPNGVDMPETPTWDGGSGGYVLWYGRFDAEHKGVDALVDGLARLPPASRPHLRLHGPDRRGDRPRLRDRAQALGIGDWVTFGDPVYGAEKESLLAACQAFVYPSRWEGFGIAPAEAVARGVPLLATPYPFAASLADRGAAMVVPATADGLADGLRRVVDADSADLAALGAAGRRVVGEAYRWDDVARSWLDQVAALQ